MTMKHSGCWASVWRLAKGELFSMVLCAVMWKCSIAMDAERDRNGWS